MIRLLLQNTAVVQYLLPKDSDISEYESDENCVRKVNLYFWLMPVMRPLDSSSFSLPYMMAEMRIPWQHYLAAGSRQTKEQHPQRNPMALNYGNLWTKEVPSLNMENAKQAGKMTQYHPTIYPRWGEKCTIPQWRDMCCCKKVGHLSSFTLDELLLKCESIWFT